MRLTAAEKAEVIRLVEGSDLSVRRTLAELGVHRSTFYAWYRRYTEDGAAGLVAKRPAAQRYWNRIPPAVRKRIVTAALADPERSPRELAWQLTDRTGHFLSESSVYRILKAADLITSPAFILIHAADRFVHPTRRPNELWQTDFTYLQVVGWGWYYLSTVLDDYSRYILAWTLTTTMQASDVMTTLDLARAKAEVDQVRVVHRPRLLSDNGPCYVSQALGTYLTQHGLTHTRGAPYHPMTQGKIERYHRSMKNVVKLDVYYSPWELERAIGALRRALQPPPAARVAAERDAGGCLRGTPGGDLGPPCADQTPDTGPAKARESERSMTTATRRECGLLTSPNGPEDSDDVQGGVPAGRCSRSEKRGGAPRGPVGRLGADRIGGAPHTRRSDLGDGIDQAAAGPAQRGQGPGAAE